MVDTCGGLVHCPRKSQKNTKRILLEFISRQESASLQENYKSPKWLLLRWSSSCKPRQVNMSCQLSSEETKRLENGKKGFKQAYTRTGKVKQVLMAIRAK